MGHHRRLATNWQCCRNHHCRLEPWTDTDSYENTAGLIHEPTLIFTTTLPVWSWTDSVGLLNTAGLSQEPTLLKQPSLSVGTTNRQCC